MGKNENNLLEFRAIIDKSRYNSEDFKIYTMQVNNKMYPNIKANKNNEYILVGNIPSLIIGMEYEIKAKATINKIFGIQYSVKSIRQDKPTNVNSSRKFLIEVITPNQTDALLKVYPNIIDKIIKNDLNDIDFKKLYGIQEFTFNKIKDKIIQNFCLIDLVDKFGGYIDMSTIKKLYDKYTSVKMIEKKLKNDPYNCLCKLSRIGFKTADSILLNLEEYMKKDNKTFFDYDLKSSDQRMKSCLYYILKENESNGNTRISIENARKECGKLVPECITLFVKVIKDDDDMHIDKETKTMSTKEAYETELYIADTLKEMIKNVSQWDIPIEIYREIKGCSMTDEQMCTLKMMCDNNIGILTAAAGSGKTASVESLINMLDDNGKSYILMTPTGASSEILSDYVKRDAGTIHRQLKYNPSAENPWTYNEKNKLIEDVVIVDEFSMVDIYLFKHLLDAIDIKRTKLLLVFDSYQLPSVGCGNLAQDLLSSKIIPTTILTKIFRYNEGGLMEVVTHIRNSKEFIKSDFKGNKVFGEKKDFIFCEIDQTYLIKQVLKIYSKLLKDGYETKDILVLSSQNKGDYGTREINKKIQYFIQRDKSSKFVMRGDTKFYLNDKVIQTINNYQAEDIYGNKTEIFNGNIGIVSQVKYNEIVVTFKDNKNIVYMREDLEQLELGYCISIHKSQGSGCKQIIMVAPKSHTFILNSNLLYVGGTRAKERVFLLGNIQTINRAIKKKENLSRDTYMLDMLIN